MKRLVVFLFLFIMSNLLFAQGRIIIPEPPERINFTQVDLKKVDARVDIKGHIGDVTLEQTFYNPSSVRLEGEYIFALPDEAQVHDFYLYIDGQKTRGQVLNAQKARQAYLNIVRKLKDPALLEYYGNSLFKARIFPIEPRSDRKIELKYAQMLHYNGQNYRFVIPIKQSGQGSIDEFHMVINLTAEADISNIYSPSHDIDITRRSQKEAHISFEANQLEGNKDFVLYYSLGEQEINGSLLTFRPRTDRDGYFIFMASPRFEVKQHNYVAKDVIFVMDNSGSMQGEKIEQAKDALRFCVNTLKERDRFEIISFNSTIQSFQGELQWAGTDEIENARYFINNLNASGGTNINEALLRALNMKREQDQRPFSVVFLTDGLPTEGVSDIKDIIQNVKKVNTQQVRIFNFGVGYDVNTFLLDKLAEDTHGSSNYVKPGENIEQEVSTFFAKISSPVLTEVELDFTDARAYDYFPNNIPDIFQGQRITLIGRYRNPGEVTIKLQGLQSGQKKEYTYRLNFDRREIDNDFIAKLWANRKVTHLLAQIRFQGENEELVKSIKALGKEYGIVTPYTSYLVTEQERELAAIDNLVAEGEVQTTAIRMKSAQQARNEKSEVDEESIGSSTYYQALSAPPEAADKSHGRGAVLSSRVMKKIALSEKEVDMILTIQNVGGKSFHLQKGVWVEQGLSDQKPALRVIKFLSDEYFRLMNEQPELKKVLAVGEQVLFQWQGETIQIVN
jgi:Ca-activated chloride channel family protein